MYADTNAHWRLFVLTCSLRFMKYRNEQNNLDCQQKKKKKKEHMAQTNQKITIGRIIELLIGSSLRPCLLIMNQEQECNDDYCCLNDSNNKLFEMIRKFSSTRNDFIGLRKKDKGKFRFSNELFSFSEKTTHRKIHLVILDVHQIKVQSNLQAFRAHRSISYVFSIVQTSIHRFSVFYLPCLRKITIHSYNIDCYFFLF